MFNNSNATHFLGASGRRGSTTSSTSSTSSSPFFPTSILQNNAFNLNQQNNIMKEITPPILATGYYFQQYQKQMAIEQNKSLRSSNNAISRQSPQDLATTLYRTSTVASPSPKQQPSIGVVVVPNQQQEKLSIINSNNNMNNVSTNAMVMTNNSNNSNSSTFLTDLPNSRQTTNSLNQQDQKQHLPNSQTVFPSKTTTMNSASSCPFDTTTTTNDGQQNKITNHHSNSNISPFVDFENECQIREKEEQPPPASLAVGSTLTNLNAKPMQQQHLPSKKLSTVILPTSNFTRQSNYQNKQIVDSSPPKSCNSSSSIVPATGSVHQHSYNINEKTSSNCLPKQQTVSPDKSSAAITAGTNKLSLFVNQQQAESHSFLNNSNSATVSSTSNNNTIGVVRNQEQQEGNKLLFTCTLPPSSLSPTLSNNNNNYLIIPNNNSQEKSNSGENYSTTTNNRTKQSAGIVPSTPKEATTTTNNHYRKNMSVSAATSNNMMMNPPPSTVVSSSSPTRTSPHLTSSLKTNVGFSSMKPPSSSSSTIIIPSPSPNRKLDIPTQLNDNSTTTPSLHNPPLLNTSPSNNNTPSPKIPALESEPPTVKLPSIYAILLNNKDPYLSQDKDQNSEIIYLRPIARMVENSKKKQSCHAQFGNNIIKKQSSLRSKIRGIVGSRRMEEFKKQTTSERAQSKITNHEDNDKKDQSSDNNLTVDVKTSSSDFNLDTMNDDTNIMAFGSSEDFGLMYDDVMVMDDQDFMSMMNDGDLGLLTDQTNSNVSTPLLNQETMRRSNSTMKHEVSHTSLSSFLSSPTTPMNNLSSNQSKDNLVPPNQNVQNTFWDNSMSGSIDIPVSSGNFFIPSSIKGSSSSISVNNANNNNTPRVVTPEVRKQEVQSMNAMGSNNNVGNRGGSHVQQSNQINKVPNNPMMNLNSSNNSMNGNMNMVNNMNVNNSMNSINSMNSNMNNIDMGNKSMNNQSMNNNQHLGMNNNMTNMHNNNLFSHNNNTMNNNNTQNDPTSNFDTNNFFNISTDTLLQGILYAQKSGINLASLFALTLQQQQNQASSYNESTNNFGNTKNNQFNNMNNGSMFNNNIFSNMGSEMFPNSNPMNSFQNNQQNQFQKSQDNTSQLLLQKLLDSNQINTSNVQNSFSSRHHSNENMFNMNNNLNSQIDSLIMNNKNIPSNNNQMLYNQSLNNQQVKFNQISSPQNQQLSSPRQNQQQNNPMMMNPSNNNNNNNRFIKTESDLNTSMNNVHPNWKESYEEPEIVSLSAPRAAGSKTETKRIKIKQDLSSLPISSPPSSQHASSTHDAGNDSSHEEDDESVSSNPQSPDKNGKKKRKSHITASQVGIVELENNEGFECSYCLRKFKRKSDIKVHIRRHTGERPYICEIDGCGKAFTTASNLRRHNRNVHTKE